MQAGGVWAYWWAVGLGDDRGRAQGMGLGGLEWIPAAAGPAGMPGKERKASSGGRLPPPLVPCPLLFL